MGISVLQFTMVAVVGTLAMMSIYKARQYHAEVNQRIDIAQRAIEERDTILKKCETDRTEAGKSAEQCKQSLQQVTSEKDGMGKKVSDLEGQTQTLQASQNTLTDELAQANNKITELEKQVSDTKNGSEAQIIQLQDELNVSKNSSAVQIKQLQDDLKKTQDELSATQGKLNGAQEQLAAAAKVASAKAATDAPAKGDKKKE